jgi:hypothetical protein
VAQPDRDLLLDPATQSADPNDFEDLDALAARITAFQAHYRQIAQPFDWTFTRTDLDALLTRLDAREPHLQLAA